MLVSQAYLNCCLYIYPSKKSAQDGAESGGSGFVAAVPADEVPRQHIYAVTAKHVIEKMSQPVLRINLVGGGFECLETNGARWIKAESSDLAVLSIDLEYENYRYWFLRIEEFVDRTLEIGPGDDTFMVGRFIGQDGRENNTPTVRFGNISMMPAEERAFMVEQRSLPGYSGSPVFVWINPGLPRLPHARIKYNPSYDPMSYGPWLLGVDSWHVQNFERILSSQNDKDFAVPAGWVKVHTGMAGVVPAWDLADLLNTEELRMQRRRDEEKTAS
jgi:hypothetical protein